MLPESSWNSPYITIEETRKESQFGKFIQLSALWESPISAEDHPGYFGNWNRIFQFQNQSLKKALIRSVTNEAYYNQLQSACWQYGKSLAEKDWPESVILHPYDAFLALTTLRVGNLRHSDCFLLERKTADACNFYWLSSPIESAELCMLYHEIFRGYFYHLSKKIRIEIHSSILPSSEEMIKVWKINLLWID